jgi:molybdate transport system substrate-binding protein
VSSIIVDASGAPKVSRTNKANGAKSLTGAGWRRRFHRLAWTLLLGALAPFPAFAGEVTVAAAADLNYALREIAQRFEQQTGHTVRLSFGSSGNLYAQVRLGAPYDVFFSADQDYPRRLAEEGHADPASLRLYGVGRLVLWLPAASEFDPEAQGMALLAEARVRRVAVANPRHAPYGRAAVEAMKHFAVHAQVKEKLVLGEQVSQAAQFVESGNADAGLIALSLALSPNMQRRGRYWLVPQEAHAPLVQAAVIPRSAPDPRLAREFLDFVFLPESIAILRRYGFAPPEEAR